MTEKKTGMTGRIAAFVTETRVSDIPDDVYEHAQVAFMDWLAVTLAGKDDPLVKKLIQYTDFLGGKEQATILGHGQKKSLTQAALINGAASHALDYDDSAVFFLGHPTVTLYPGLLALCEFKGLGGEALLTAYIVGLKAGLVIGTCAGGDHYMSGFHGTCTMGCLASASACSHLLGLNIQKTRYALGIAGTQAGGLKSVFGTMCKPFHAGRASEVGVTASLLAENGFTSAEDILEGPNGLFQAMKGSVDEKALETLGKTWDIEGLIQKYHASCHFTHSPIEAVWSILEKEGVAEGDIKSLTVHSSEMGLSAAFRTEARTGLEGKFSIPYCVANAILRGRGNTGLQAFTEERVNDPRVQELMTRIQTNKADDISGLGARVEIETMSGKTYSEYYNVNKAIPELAMRREKITEKFMDLAQPLLGRNKTKRLVEAINGLREMEDVNALIGLL
jgi:2-methylcitrate dehydratase PrpD